jgi:hypothetical protein
LPEKKPTTRKPTVRRKKKVATPAPEEIAVRAYFLHLEDATAASSTTGSARSASW